MKLLLTIALSVLLLTCSQVPFGEWNNPLDLNRDELTSPQEVSNIETNMEFSLAQINWTNPNDADFKFVDIYYGIFSADTLYVRTEDTSLTLEGLVGDTSYLVKFCTIDNIGNSSEGVELGLQTSQYSDNNNAIVISFNREEDVLASGTDMTIKATTNIVVDSYKWFLNSVLLENNTDTLTFGSELDNGSYSLTLVVDKDSNKTAKTNIFTVEDIFVGDNYGGGIVFWLDVDNGGGLISASADQGSSIKWSNGLAGSDTSYIGGTGKNIGTGFSNTAAIIAAQGSGTYAALICNNIELNGYDDWFLPSQNELLEMYNKKDIISGFDSGIISGYYWSSSENDLSDAFAVNFGNGQSYSYGKDDGFYNIRCIRAF